MPCQVPNAAMMGSWGDKERAGEIGGPFLNLATLTKLRIAGSPGRGTKARNMRMINDNNKKIYCNP